MCNKSYRKVFTIAVVILPIQVYVLYSPLRNVHTAVGNIKQTEASHYFIYALVIKSE